MRIGICSYWFNRGQAVVSRQLRSALDSLGHETFVLARPTRASNLRPAFVDRTGVWDQPGVTQASRYDIPATEYLAWAEANRIEACFFDQNYGFDAIAGLRRSGVTTLGRFVWEQFSRDHVEPAREAFDVVYAVTDCERERYACLGLATPRVPWGIHPELLAHSRERNDDGTTSYFFPGGFMSARKPYEAVLAAFRRVRRRDIRLVFKAQVDRGMRRVRWRAWRDRRIQVVSEDLPTDEHLRLFASADVCLAPSRWEGLGLHLFEAMALGLPVITNDNPPMNEVVVDGENGVLVPGRERGRAKSGIPAYEPDVAELARAIERLADPAERARLAAGVEAARERLRWDRTVAALDELVRSVG